MPRTDLPDFAAAVAARLPGHWTTTSAHFTYDTDQLDLTDDLWDDGQLTRILSKDALPGDIAFLDSPGQPRLLLLDHPSRPRQSLAGPLFPLEFADVYAHGITPPHGISTARQPARAAEAIARRLLPVYTTAVHRLRLNTVNAAADQALTCEEQWRRAVAHRHRLSLPFQGVRASIDARRWASFHVFLSYSGPLLAQAWHRSAVVAKSSEQFIQWRASLTQLYRAFDSGHRLQGPITAHLPYAALGAQAVGHIHTWLRHHPIINEIELRDFTPPATNTPHRTRLRAALLSSTAREAHPATALTAPAVPTSHRPGRSR